jgi:SAM-dependent methyltransferase
MPHGRRLGSIRHNVRRAGSRVLHRVFRPMDRPSKDRLTQVDATEHYGESYLGLPRLVVIWRQAKEVARLVPGGGEVLEIGPGAGYATFLLRTWGMRVTTMDFDPKINPDVVGDVTNPCFMTGSFDCVLAAQVLEHIPLEEFETAVKELARITKRYVVITLPAPLIGLAGLLNAPSFSPVPFTMGLPYYVKHQFDGQHYWELGKRGSSVKHVRQKIMKYLDIIDEFRPALSLRCYFFVAQKRPS